MGAIGTGNTKERDSSSLLDIDHSPHLGNVPSSQPGNNHTHSPNIANGTAKTADSKVQPPDKVKVTEQGQGDGEDDEPVSVSRLPEGGYGWVVAVLALLLNAGLTMGLASFSILFVELVEHFHTSNTQVAWLGALYLAAMAASCVHAEVMKRVGVRRMGFIMAAVASTTYLVSSLSSHLWILYITYALIPGTVFCYYGLAGVVTLHTWFDKKISLAMAINFSGIALGHFMWAPLTSWLVNLYTWKGALLILSAINLHCLVIFALLKTPEQYYGPRYKSPQDEEPEPHKSLHQIWFEKLIPSVCKDPTYVMFHLLNVFFNMSYMAGMSYLPTRYFLAGGQRQTGAFLLAIVGVTMGILRPVHGVIGDRFPNCRTWLFFAYEGLSGASLVVSVISDSFAWLAVCAAFFAAFAAGYVVLTFPAITDLWGREQVQHIGAHLYTDIAIAGLIFNPIAGALMDATQGASAPFLLFGSLQILAVLLGLLLVHRIKRRNQEHRPKDQQSTA